MSALPILLLGLHFCWYGVLVFATGRILVRWIPLRPEALLGAGVVGASFLGYAAFWIFLLSVPAGVAFDVVILLACALSIRRHAAQARQLDVVIPGLLVLFIALFYVGVLGAHADSDDLSGMTNTRFVQRTYDDALPQVVAERIYNGLDPRILDYGWRSSDRPPLQTGVVLLQRPFVTAGIWTRDSYEIVGLLFQLAWIPALWYLGRTIGVGMQQLFLSIVLVAMTGFVFMNSTYVWPKCSAAALEIFAISVAISKLLGGVIDS